MSIDAVDPQQFQAIEHKQRLLNEQLRQCMAQQCGLREEEARLRSQITKLDNDLHGMMKP
jgi:hypothetical protein